MKTVFADSGYWIGLLNKNDQLHKRAQEVSGSLGSVRIITSEVVLTEVRNTFCEQGEQFRRMAGDFVYALQKDANTTIEPQTHRLFLDSLDVYTSRPDKGYSLTDCASFVIMERLDIAEALSHDKHFEQAGYKALLR